MLSDPARRLAAVVLIAVLVAGGAIAVSASSSDPAPPAPEPSTLLAGIPERDGVLGAADAPVTVTEFVDLQCPVCAIAARDLLPTVIADHVRTGEVKLDARTLSFLGPDSVTAARYAAGAREQGRLWPFLEAFLASQGQEGSGYVTKDFLAGVAEAAGVDHEAATAYAASTEAQAALDAADAEAQRLSVTGTPSFVVAQRGRGERVVSAGELLGTLER